MNDSTNKDDGAGLDWLSRGDSGMNAVLAWHHQHIAQERQWAAAALAARGIASGPGDTHIKLGTDRLAIEGQELSVVEERRNVEEPRTTPPEILISANIINLGDMVTEGQLIDSVAVPWFEILKELERDPQFLHQLGWRKMEELVAGAYQREGWPEVILTPRSGDGGRDIIVSKPGVGAVRFIDQVKAYAPGHRVPAEDVRALYGVLTRDQNVSKGIVTTTATFAPGVYEEWKAFMPFRLELKDGPALTDWLRRLRGPIPPPTP